MTSTKQVDVQELVRALDTFAAMMLPFVPEERRAEFSRRLSAYLDPIRDSSTDKTKN